MSFQSDKNNLLNLLQSQSQPCTFDTMGAVGVGDACCVVSGGVGCTTGGAVAEDFDMWPYGHHFEDLVNFEDDEDALVHQSYTVDGLDKSNKIDVVCIDIDQTIGDVSMSSLFYKIYNHYEKRCDVGPPYNTVGWFFEAGGFRPYLKELMQYLHKLRETGKIKKIIVHTSINNYNRYVNWIVSCLENYCERYHLIDEIRDRRTATAYEDDSSTIKELGPNDILIDDKPWNAVPQNRAIKVLPYYCTIDGAPYADYFSGEKQNTIKNIFIKDRGRNRDPIVDAADAQNDRELNDLLTELKKLFD